MNDRDGAQKGKGETTGSTMQKWKVIIQLIGYYSVTN